MNYQWKIPKYTAVSAQVAGEHIEELEAIHGKVTPKILLDDSRPTEAVLHPLYEWDDQIAAEKYRLSQSGDIVRNLVIIRPIEITPEPRQITIARVEQEPTPEQEPTSEKETIPKQEVAPVRAFVSVRESDENAYKSVSKVVTDEDLYVQAVGDILKAIAELKTKYANLASFKEALKEALSEELDDE